MATHTIPRVPDTDSALYTRSKHKLLSPLSTARARPQNEHLRCDPELVASAMRTLRLLCLHHHGGSDMAVVRRAMRVGALHMANALMNVHLAE